MPTRNPNSGTRPWLDISWRASSKARTRSGELHAPDQIGAFNVEEDAALPKSPFSCMNYPAPEDRPGHLSGSLISVQAIPVFQQPVAQSDFFSGRASKASRFGPWWALRAI